jgi:acetylornithine deacetylase/succinyl-diaminopimelate desuccinylase-like protein
MTTTEDIIAFIRQLVATPSQTHIDSEAGVAKVVFDKLTSFGFEPQMLGADMHPSVICHIKKAGASKTVWFESPLDTVPAGEPKKWDYPPFEGRIVGEKMYGRGSADAKTAIAMFCYLAKELSKDKEFDASIFLSFDAEEQGGEFTGIRKVLKKAPKADLCILGYQGIEEISIGARGWLRTRITTLGKAAHTGSRTRKGHNAIHEMGKVINALASLKLEGATEKFFEFGSALNLTQIEGGLAINMIPDKCEANADIRLLPSQAEGKVLDAIRQKLEELKGQDPEFQYQLEVLQSEQAYLTDPENPFVQILHRIAEQTLDKKISLVASGQGGAGNIISRSGIPIINAFGVESDHVHAPNEWINVATIPKIYDIYRESLREFCK